MKYAVLVGIGLLAAAVRCASAGASEPLLLGQAVPAGSAGGVVLDLVANLGTVGFLVWYCWFVTAKAIPRLQQEFCQQLERVEQSHRQEVADLRHTLETMMRQVLENRRADGSPG